MQNLMTENMTSFHLHLTEVNGRKVVVWYELQFRHLSEGTGVCPWVCEDRLYADQDFKQGSSNTKQEYYPFGRSLLFRGIVRRFRNEKKFVRQLWPYIKNLVTYIVLLRLW